MQLTRKKIFIGIGTIIVLTVAVAGIWYKSFRITYDQYGIPNPPVSFEYVSSRPEARLFYSNGKVFSPFGSGQTRSGMCDGGYCTAFAGAIMTSNDSPAQVYAWYRDWLLSHGWQVSDIDPGLGGSQISLQAYMKNGAHWSKARETFYIAMDNPELLSGAVGRNIEVSATTTVFEFRYMIK